MGEQDTQPRTGKEGPTRIRAHIWVSGRVQGVFFRAYTEDEAVARGLAGWVRNARDGRVEAVFEGEKSAVDSMIQWCHRGSPASRVTGVEVRWEEVQGERSFSVRF